MGWPGCWVQSREIWWKLTLVNSILSLQFCDVKDKRSYIYVQTCTWYLHFLWILIDLCCRHLLFSLKMEWKKLTRWCCTSISKFDRQIYLHLCAKVPCFAIGLEERWKVSELWYRLKEQGGREQWAEYWGVAIPSIVMTTNLTLNLWEFLWQPCKLP